MWNERVEARYYSLSCRWETHMSVAHTPIDWVRVPHLRDHIKLLHTFTSMTTCFCFLLVNLDFFLTPLTWNTVSSPGIWIFKSVKVFLNVLCCFKCYINNVCPFLLWAKTALWVNVPHFLATRSVDLESIFDHAPFDWHPRYFREQIGLISFFLLAGLLS